MTEFVCEVDERYRSACAGLPFYSEHEGHRYCVLHYPGKRKNTDAHLHEVIKDKLKEEGRCDFAGAYFTDSTEHFSYLEFGSSVSFVGATFGNDESFYKATFKKDVTFHDATFEGDVDFRFATFEEDAWFQDVTFGGRADFSFSSFQEGAWFSYTRGTTFEGDADFQRVRFENYAGFSGTVFQRNVRFPSATFTQNASFEESTFGRTVDFRFATFCTTLDEVADFRRATFEGELYFRAAKFYGNTDFYRANFLDAVKFVGGEEAGKERASEVFAPEGWVSLRRARAEKPGQVSFDTIRLRPSWLVGVDARKFDFTAVEWYGLSDDPKDGIDDEIERVRQKEPKSDEYALLAQACQRLAANAEENRDYPTANEFHYWAMDALRKRRWSHLRRLKERLTRIRQKWPRVQSRCGTIMTLRLAWRVISGKRLSGPTKHFGLIATFYWAMSGYGVRAARAFWVLAGICVAFAVFYMLLGPTELQNFWTALVYSMGAIARLNPNPRPDPATDPGHFQFLVIVEGLLGPLQIALLALAIRRKVMR
jgi:uncharacterized protein YjbI with pentapeptide repeats